MDTKASERLDLKKTEGAIIILVAACLVFLLAIAALAIDIGYLYATRNELQNVADAAALAGARYLGETYSGMSENQIEVYEFSKADVLAKINETAELNDAAQESIPILLEDLRIGRWDPSKSSDDVYMETLIAPDAVSVVARRDNSEGSSPVGTFFARILNINTASVTSARAVAALTGPSYVEESELNTPFGISQLKKCDDEEEARTVTFNPNRSCGGWHNFLWDNNANDMATNALRIIRDHTDVTGGLWNGETWLKNNWPDLNWDQLNKTVDKMLKGTPVPEFFETGDRFNFNNGTISSLFNGSRIDPADTTYAGNKGNITGSPTHKPAAAFALFDYFRFRDNDGDDTVWTAKVPIYKESGTCDSMSGWQQIVGFAMMVIEKPVPPPLSLWEGQLDCNLLVDDNRGGGTVYGNLRGKIPNLVK